MHSRLVQRISFFELLFQISRLMDFLTALPHLTGYQLGVVASQ